MRRVALPLVLALVSACGGEAPAASRWSGSVDTLASGGLVVSNPEEGTWSEDERWTLEEDLRIGALESAGPDQFGQIADVAVDGRGRLWVLERQAAEIRVFDRDGSHARTIGRKGGGPGEFQMPIELLSGPAGAVWVNDLMNRRWEVFDTTGTRVAGHAIPGTGFGPGGRFDSEGRLLMRDFIRDEDGSTPILVRYLPGETLEPVDTLSPVDMGEGESHEVSGSSGDRGFVMVMPIPFVHQPRAHLQEGGFWWAWRGGEEGYRFMKLDLEGDTTLLVERAHTPVPVTAHERDSLVNREGPMGMELDFPEDRIPDVHPPFESVHHLPDGHILVDRVVAEGGVRAWDVFDPEGRYLGQLDRPAGYESFRLNAARDDALYGVVRGEFDEQYVVRLRLRRATGSG